MAKVDFGPAEKLLGTMSGPAQSRAACKPKTDTGDGHSFCSFSHKGEFVVHLKQACVYGPFKFVPLLMHNIATLCLPPTLQVWEALSTVHVQFTCGIQHKHRTWRH